MRLALVLTILLLSGYTTGLAATEVKNFPLAPAAQACLDAKPSASNDPEGFLRCLDIIEADAGDRWTAMYVAQHPATQACRDNPPSPSDPSLASLCRTLIDQEDTAVAHHTDKLRVNMGLLRTSVMERAAKKAAWAAAPQCDAACRRYRQARRDVEMDDATFEAELRADDPSLLLGEYLGRGSISCTSYQLGMFTNTDCY